MAKKSKKKVKKKAKAKRRQPARKKPVRRKPVRKAVRPSRKNARAERDLEEGLRESFPGSDALAITDPTRSIKE
jgi:hypothetical protein